MPVNEKYPRLNFNIVLVEPEIPMNTGNIGRTCVATFSRLHLIRPLGFEISDKRLKRAGLDYWGDLELVYYDHFDQWFEQLSDISRVFFFSTKAHKSYFDIQYKPGDWLVFGKETKGLREDLLKKYSDQAVTIPFPGKVRSFNLSNTVAMALGEGMRQLSEL